MARQLHKLSAREVGSITTPGLHSDGGGLYLFVQSESSRAWRFIYRERGTGKRRELGLGSAAKRGGLSLAAARTKAEAFRRQITEGADPVATKRAAEAAGSDDFGSFADALLEDIKSGFKNEKSAADWKRDLTTRCAPLRPKTLAVITTADVLGVLAPIWTTKNRTARELRGRIERVMDAARAKGHRTGENPARWRGNLKELLPTAKKRKRHHPAAHYRDVPGIVLALRANHPAADTAVNLAAEFVILTAVRTGEARRATVAEIDLQGALWTIPAARMKMDRDHVVPLSARAVAILKVVIPAGAKPGAYVFAGQWNTGKPLGPRSILDAIQAVAPGMTTHGMRSSFRDWAGDETGFPRDVAEMALAHKVGDEVEQAYRRGSALAKRRQLMDAWGAFVDGGGAKVLRLVPGA